MKKIVPIMIICLFLATGFEAAALQKDIVGVNQTPQTTCLYDDDLDQYMTEYQDGSVLPVGVLTIEEALNIHFSIAQSFIPQKEVITRALLYVGRNITASYSFVVSIRDNLTGADLTQVAVPVESFVIQNFSWVEFDFPDLPVTIGETYYIVAYTNNVSDNWYGWGGNVDNIYSDGCAWASVDDGDTWTNDSVSMMSYPYQFHHTYHGLAAPTANDSMDMCFMTYGQDNLPPSIPDITGPSQIPPETETAYTFTSTDPEMENIYYMVDWGDGTTSDWLGPYASGETGTADHTWDTRGTYVIKVKAKDATGHESDWGELEITVPVGTPATDSVKTLVWGTILLPRFKPDSITFRALNVHYRYLGQLESGTFKHKRLTFGNEFRGRIGNHFVFAIFDGTPSYW
jgi:hypothetical protein